MAFSIEDHHDLISLPFRMFSDGVAQGVSDVIQGARDGRDVVDFDYEYQAITMGMLEAPATFETSCALVALPAVCPEFMARMASGVVAPPATADASQPYSLLYLDTISPPLRGDEVHALRRVTRPAQERRRYEAVPDIPLMSSPASLPRFTTFAKSASSALEQGVGPEALTALISEE
jgi:hypothetical protein